jgi:hypothetical protein
LLARVSTAASHLRMGLGLLLRLERQPVLDPLGPLLGAVLDAESGHRFLRRHQVLFGTAGDLVNE